MNPVEQHVKHLLATKGLASVLRFLEELKASPNLHADDIAYVEQWVQNYA